jgi:hypothetical protein
MVDKVAELMQQLEFKLVDLRDEHNKKIINFYKDEKGQKQSG